MNVMVLVAHADDETLGAGGYIPQLVAQGHRITCVIMSDGILTVRGVKQDNRTDVYKAAKILGIHEVHFLDYEDQKFDKYILADLANSVFKLKIAPDFIISHVDSDLNNDHKIVADIAKIVGRPKKKPITILGCEIPNTTAWNGVPFHANYYVNIEKTLEKKIKAFSQYRNELQKFPHPWSKEGLTVLAKMRGMESGCRLAEGFHVVRVACSNG